MVYSMIGPCLLTMYGMCDGWKNRWTSYKQHGIIEGGMGDRVSGPPPPPPPGKSQVAIGGFLRNRTPTRSNWTPFVQLLIQGGLYGPLSNTLMAKKQKKKTLSGPSLTIFSGSTHAPLIGGIKLKSRSILGICFEYYHYGLHKFDFETLPLS